MAITKSEAAKLTQDLLLRGVIETIIKESQLLQLLPFYGGDWRRRDLRPGGHPPAASFYDVGGAWTEAATASTTVTAALKITGGDADVDNLPQATHADPNDLEAEVIASRSRAVAHKFLDRNFARLLGSSEQRSSEHW